MPTLQQKRGTALALETANPTPLAGEIVWVSDTNTLRVGDGTTAYSSLAVISATPTSHSHGNITNAGAIGSTANLPIITTTSGVLTTGSFGTTAATFCQGNDSRLSDTRTPTDGSVTTAKLANDAVTYAKLQNVSATDRLLGRSSAGAGDVEEITCTAFGRSLIDDADAAAARTTLSVQPTASPAFTGGPSVSNSGANDNSTIRYGNGSKNWYVGLRGDTSNVFAITDDSAFRFSMSSGGVAEFFGQLLVTAGSASACGVAFSGDTNTGLYSPGADELAVSTNQTERLLIDASGNIRINGAAAATSAVGAVHIKNGTAPSASITDGIVLFAADVSSFSELRVRDEAGNVTTLSPHAFPLIPEGPSEPMAWSYYSERDGRRINVDMLRVVRLLEQMTGEKLVYEE